MTTEVRVTGTGINLRELARDKVPEAVLQAPQLVVNDALQALRQGMAEQDTAAGRHMVAVVAQHMAADQDMVVVAAISGKVEPAVAAEIAVAHHARRRLQLSSRKLIQKQYRIKYVKLRPNLRDLPAART